jgi:hypothetical protein
MAAGQRSAWSQFLVLCFGMALLAAGNMVALSSTSGPSASAALPSGEDAIRYLEQTIDWYRHLSVEEQLVTDPRDVLFLNDDRQLANQVLGLSFDFARADARLLSGQVAPATSPNQTAASTSSPQLQAAAEADADIGQAQTKLNSLMRQLRLARGRRRQQIQSAIAEARGELALAQTRSQTLHQILQFANAPEAGGTGDSLLARIDELQRSVPQQAANSTPPWPTQAASSAANAAVQPAANRPQGSGLLSIGANLIALTGRMHTLDRTVALTTGVSESLQKLRAPLVDSLKNIAQQGEQLSKHPDTNDPAELVQQKQQLDTLRASFQQLSSLVVPLAKQSALLASYKANLGHWHSAVTGQYAIELRNLLMRVVIFGIVVVAVMTLVRFWRTVIFRYIHDARRRYTFLLLRRIVLWCAIGITIAFALASEIGSIATFAGLITAGVAVAMQNVILAIAGYFFLIGK